MRDNATPVPLIGLTDTDTVESHFVRFYAVYPKHTAKEAARRAYVKAVKKVSPEKILAGAERFRDDPTRNPQYTPHPATWLNAGRWDDEDVVATPPQLVRRW